MASVSVETSLFVRLVSPRLSIVLLVFLMRLFLLLITVTILVLTRFLMVKRFITDSFPANTFLPFIVLFQRFSMNKYTFFYLSDSVSGELCATYRARKLSSALRIFRRESRNFASPVSSLLPHYEVVNSEGKLSFRFLPEKYLEELV